MAKDAIHDAVRQALINDDWNITAEHYKLEFQEFKLFADISAERRLVAERNGKNILIEVKSFSGRSFVKDLQLALGQYQIYRDIINLTKLDFKLYLAISTETYNQMFMRLGAQTIIELHQIKLLIVNIEKEEIIKWVE